MLISLKYKKALVGGASQGLGLAVAKQLAASGASVTIMARNEEKLKTVVAALPVSENQKHNYLVADFSDFEKYKKIIDHYFLSNQVDILVNNTNGPKAGTVLEKTSEDYLSAFNLLFQTVQYTTAKVVKGMKENKYGRIINLTSRTIKEPVDNLALSNTIRAAVVAWGKTLSRDVGKYNITVNNILTGNFDTERLAELFETQAKMLHTTVEEITKKSITDIPLQRLGMPEELANVVAFLASEQAAYVTGASIPVDGGLLKSI
ncbi:SDR family oxidoreductase [Niabella ginsengisoli]|uniref:SDR family oxidoreductase n=1 Tax=Niabella ginsengisoli TaxID=522298 RepID=A0ABS9SF13_9BACT|nr:SDR family oxidoreductase [Niabella ginsengisoli]MCH5596952.1 SDR family oxidoreductase [Niabella ginsengisoli]